MPPRARGRGRGGPLGPPAAGRGGAPGPPASAAGRGGTPAGARGGGAHVPAAHVEAIGVRRQPPGTSGRKITVTTNHYAVDVATGVIHHYDGLFFVIHNIHPFTRYTQLSRHIVGDAACKDEFRNHQTSTGSDRARDIYPSRSI